MMNPRDQVPGPEQADPKKTPKMKRTPKILLSLWFIVVIAAIILMQIGKVVG